ncbi:MAG TPA: TetR/AcrR family transcriptional regulator [Kofleriaceae bacterium]|nr:TetR/AcrR family transcriptional regulator [Kofleriaceae bacterium]
MPARPASLRSERSRRPRASARRPKRNTPPRAAARESALSVYRDAILQAAEDELAQRGYVATKMLDIARRAGMSVGALYRYFDSKEAIFGAMVQRSGDRLVEEMRASVTGVKDLRARLGRLVESLFRFIEDHRAMFLVFHQLPDVGRAQCEAMAHQSDSARERSLALYRAVLADGMANGTLRDDVDLDDQLAFVTGAIHGFLDTWIRAGGETGLVDKAPLITDLTLRALGGSP